MAYETITTERDGAVGIITLNRPKVLNALNVQLMTELVDALDEFDRDAEIRAIALVGSDKAFAAGADIGEMAQATPVGLLQENRFERWDRIRKVSKPVIAGVSGHCLGGGCELAMLCDIIVASETAKFGQPEINLGVMPGAGGTQRLPRAVGKAKAMDLCLTARMMDAQEAERAGLVSRVVPADKLMEEALAVAAKIAGYSLPVVMMLKESINRAYETALSEGILFERRLFHSQFALEDQKEGMAAFLEKRKPVFKNK